MRVAVFSICYNEAMILPSFLRHYEKFCQKIIVYDNGSIDGSREIVLNHSFAELIDFRPTELNDETNRQIKNNCWKPFRNEFDWIICVDQDEFLYHENITHYLEVMRHFGVIVPHGFNIIGDNYPTETKDLFEQYKKGYPYERESKPCIFNPKKIQEINYGYGAHNCKPIYFHDNEYNGSTLFTGDNVKLLHFKQLSYEYYIEKNKANGQMLSEFNIKNRLGWHLQKTFDRDKFNELLTKATEY
jgi:glycosyltransferase involved in cell wall biosynthesis